MIQQGKITVKKGGYFGKIFNFDAVKHVIGIYVKFRNGNKRYT
jgi:hypothetical protein